MSATFSGKASVMHDLPDLKGATIAFDLDGTLVDTAPDLVSSLNALLAEHSLPDLLFEDVMRMVGAGAWMLVQRGFAAVGESLTEADKPRVFGRFLDIYTDRIADESRPYPGCLEALDALANAGATLVVCTNKLTGLSVALLDALGMTHRFAAVIGQDSAPAAKPDARHLWTAIAAAGGVRDRAILVGDSDTDFNAARASGAPVILVPFGYSEADVRTLGADAFCETWREVPETAARLLARG
jgi:phosphoglycolate phosphatase